MGTSVPEIPVDLTRPPSRPGSRGAADIQDAQPNRRWQPGAVCSICGETIYSYQRFNFDHEVPMFKGGGRGRANKRLAHCICNAVKADRYPFSMRTMQERALVRSMVSESIWALLLRAWRGMP